MRQRLMKWKNAFCFAQVGFGVGVLALFTAGVTLGGDASRWPCQLFPDTWVPSLEQVQENVTDSLAARLNQSQQALNRSSQDLADLADAQLFITYVSLMQRLNEKEQNKLFDEQKQWLAQRAASSRAAVVSKGGSLEKLEYAQAFRSTTEKRLTELRSRLSSHATPFRKTQESKEKQPCN